MIRLLEVAPGVVPEFRQILTGLDIDYVFSKPARFMFPSCENGTYRKVSTAVNFLAAQYGLGVVSMDAYV